MSAIYILWLRDMKKYLRGRTWILASLGQPLLYLLGFGFGFGPTFQKSGQGNYIQYLAPGVIGMTILFMSIFSGIGLMWDRRLGLLKETLVAPVHRLQIMIGKTLGGATVAVLQGLIVLVLAICAGFRPVSVVALPVALVFMLLIAMVFTALGVGIGSVLENMQSFQLVMNYLVLPTFFLSGALFPFRDLPTLLAILTALDPLSYGVDGLHYALGGSCHFGPWVDVAVLGLVAVAFLTFGACLFSRIQV
jgi:ABC-2 type transport system permease protein